jgi:hypothetical protein
VIVVLAVVVVVVVVIDVAREVDWIKKLNQIVLIRADKIPMLTISFIT